ncbi:MAG TPA: hypothetical protein VHJ38_12665 [Nitrososphaeraceae archaeon]|jgi:hypothetical protein|nr:hypothetical protein [Nitrososphaeraceae archaeon]
MKSTNKKFFQIYFIISLVGILTSITLFSLGKLITNDYSNFKEVYGQGGHGHNLPPSIIGDREISLKFNNPQINPATEKNGINFALVDNKTGNNIPHVTYIVSIYNQESKNTFTASLHGHDGEIKLEFLNTGLEGYNIHANYDLLSASYVSDFGSPIKIDGSVFSDPGKYRVVTEITGIDYDNTFLPEPLKYEFNIDVK